MTKTKTKTKLRTVSHSQYKLWSDCPLQWKLTTIDRIAKSEDSIYNVFGLAIHETIQYWLDIVFNGSMLVARTIDLSDIYKEKLFDWFRRKTIKVDGENVFVCDKPTLIEFFNDGMEILRWLQKNVEVAFSVAEWELIGIEIPLELIIPPGVRFSGYIDIVLKHRTNGKIKIIDLKATTKGWNKWKKKDKPRTDQLLLYKKYYAEQFNVPEDNIVCEFYIFRRQLWEESDWPIPRLSKIVPSQKKPSMKAMNERFQAFIDMCFDDEGNRTGEHCKPPPSRGSCMFCPYNQTEHCSVGVKIE